jgi:hypothetical protein
VNLEASFWGDENVLELHSEDGNKRVNFIVGELSQ